MSEQARQWLEQNPDDPRAEAVRQKLQSMPTQEAPQSQGNPQAEKWLQENPDDPRAEAVRQKLGSTGKVVDEAHPAISWKDRAIVKNFGTGNGLGYLKSKYPNLQIEERSGDVVMKGKNENEWRKLDPSSLEFADVSDIAYDVGAGILEGGATLAGAGAGSLPGAIAAGSASGAGMEALRQKIGQALGVNKEMDMGQMGAATVAGGLSPVLFGTGKAGAKYLEKGLLGETLGKGASKAYKKVTRGFLPGMAEVSSGEKAKVYKDYIRNIDEMENWKKDPESFLNFAEEAGMAVEKNVNDAVSLQGDKIGQVLSELPDLDLTKVIDIRPVRNEMVQQASLMAGNPKPKIRAAGEEQLKILKEIFGDHKLGADGNPIPTDSWKDFVSFKDAEGMRNEFTDLNKQFKTDFSGGEFSDMKKKYGIEGWKNVDKAVKDSLNSYGGDTGNRLKQAHSEYRKALANRNRLEKKIFTVDPGTGEKDYTKVFDLGRTLDNPSKKLIKTQISKMSPDFIKAADKIEAFARLSDPSYFPTSGPSTSTTKTLAMAGLGAGVGAIGGDQKSTGIGLGIGLLGMGPKAWRFYFSKGKSGEDFLKRKFKEAGAKVPNDIKKYYNKQMATQGTWNTLRDREAKNE